MRSLKLAEPLQQSLRDYLKLEQQDVVEKTAHNISEKKRRSRPLGAQSFDREKEDTTEFDAMMQTGVFQVSPDMIEALNSVKSQPPKKLNQVNTLNTGDWLTIKQDGKSILAKLAWKAEDSNLFIFVDRDGKRVGEFNAEDLAKKFESGEVSTDAGTADSEKTRFSFMTQLR